MNAAIDTTQRRLAELQKEPNPNDDPIPAPSEDEQKLAKLRERMKLKNAALLSEQQEVMRLRERVQAHELKEAAQEEELQLLRAQLAQQLAESSAAEGGPASTADHANSEAAQSAQDDQLERVVAAAGEELLDGVIVQAEPQANDALPDAVVEEGPDAVKTKEVLRSLLDGAAARENQLMVQLEEQQEASLCLEAELVVMQEVTLMLQDQLTARLPTDIPGINPESTMRDAAELIQKLERAMPHTEEEHAVKRLARVADATSPLDNATVIDSQPKPKKMSPFKKMLAEKMANAGGMKNGWAVSAATQISNVTTEEARAPIQTDLENLIAKLQQQALAIM